MTTALVLGGADTLHEDIARYAGPVDGVVACNEAGIEWAGELDAWATLHPRLLDARGWRQARADRGYPAARALYCHASAQDPVASDFIRTQLELPGQRHMHSGSSGLLAVKVALIDLGFDRAILFGIPMTAAPHLNGRTNWTGPRNPVDGFRIAWLDLDREIASRIRSMSGWTRVLFGAPEPQEETHDA